MLLKEEFKWVGKQQIIIPLDVNENLSGAAVSFWLPKVMGNQVMLRSGTNKALIRQIHRGPVLNDILLRLTGVKNLTLIDASS